MAEERLSLFLASAVVFVAQFSASSSLSRGFPRIVATFWPCKSRFALLEKARKKLEKFTRNFEVLFWFFLCFLAMLFRELVMVMVVVNTQHCGEETRHASLGQRSGACSRVSNDNGERQ